MCELILGKYLRSTVVLGFAHYDVMWQISWPAAVKYLSKRGPLSQKKPKLRCRGRKLIRIKLLHGEPINLSNM